MTESAAPYIHPVLPTSPDANVERVRAKLLLRSQIGLKKYGVTTERPDLDLLAWARHLQEELLDAAVYVERIMDDLRQLNRILNGQGALLLIDDSYSLAEIEAELELQALETGDLEK